MTALEGLTWQLAHGWRLLGKQHRVCVGGLWNAIALMCTKA